jgi:hypothetical protein
MYAQSRCPCLPYLTYVSRGRSSEDSIERRNWKIWMEGMISTPTIKWVSLEKCALIREDCMEYMRHRERVLGSLNIIKNHG